MNNFLEEKEKLLNSIENNTSEHWKEYYKNVPIDCIFDDLVIDINEIKRLTEENQELKADYGTKAQVERDLLMEENQSLKKQLEERPKEYVFIGNAQNKTRDFINQIIKENREYKEVINNAIEYLENKRIREKAIIDIDVLEGILKEVE